jgi:hypothetical protein
MYIHYLRIGEMRMDISLSGYALAFNGLRIRTQVREATVEEDKYACRNLSFFSLYFYNNHDHYNKSMSHNLLLALVFFDHLEFPRATGGDGYEEPYMGIRKTSCRFGEAF